MGNEEGGPTEELGYIYFKRSCPKHLLLRLPYRDADFIYVRDIFNKANQEPVLHLGRMMPRAISIFLKRQILLGFTKDKHKTDAYV